MNRRQRKHLAAIRRLARILTTKLQQLTGFHDLKVETMTDVEMINGDVIEKIPTFCRLRRRDRVCYLLFGNIDPPWEPAPGIRFRTTPYLDGITAAFFRLLSLKRFLNDDGERDDRLNHLIKDMYKSVCR